MAQANIPPPQSSREFEEESGLKTPRGKSSGDNRAFLRGLRSGIRTRFTDPNYIPAVYSEKTEAVFKVVSYASGYRVKAAMDYIARLDTDKKKDVEYEDGEALTFRGEKGVLSVYDEWRKDFGSGPGRALARKKRDAVHIMFSCDCEHTEENAKKVLAAAREVSAREFSDKGHQYIAALHRDSRDLHVHFVIKCKSDYRGQPKLRINPRDILHIRTQYAQELTKLGIERVATLRKDRLDISVLVKRGLIELERNERQFQRAMRRAAPTRNALEYRKTASKMIVRLRDQVKKQTKQGTKERLELLGSLRKIERKITKSRPGIEKEIAASFRQYSQDIKRIDKLVGQAVTVPGARKKDRKRINKLVQENRNALKDNLTLAKQIIKAANLPDQAKKDSLFILGQYEKDMTAALGKGAISCEKSEIKPAFFRTKTPIFGQSLGIANEFKTLNSAVKAGVTVAAMQPRGAVDRLHKTRKIEQLSPEIQKQIMKARENIKIMNVDPAFKNLALTELRYFEKRVNERLNNRSPVKKKQITPQNSIAKMKTLYMALKAQKPTIEKDKERLEKRLAEMEAAIKKEIFARNRKTRQRPEKYRTRAGMSAGRVRTPRKGPQQRDRGGRSR